MPQTVVLSTTIIVGQSEQLHVTPIDAFNKPTSSTSTPAWSTSNNTIVSINANLSDCIITGVAPGNAVITCTVGAFTATFNVTVTAQTTPAAPIDHLVIGLKPNP